MFIEKHFFYKYLTPPESYFPRHKIPNTNLEPCILNNVFTSFSLVRKEFEKGKLWVANLENIEC
jgi:hypothetical protein